MVTTEAPQPSEAETALVQQERKSEREYQREHEIIKNLLKIGAITSEQYLAKERELHAKRTRNP